MHKNVEKTDLFNVFVGNNFFNQINCIVCAGLNG